VEKNMREKRKHARIPITAKVSRIEDGKKNFYFTKDLSVGGIFIVTREDIPIGTEIDLELAVQGVKELLKIRGRVVRIEKDGDKIEGYGVQFINILDEDSLSIKKLLESSE